MRTPLLKLKSVWVTYLWSDARPAGARISLSFMFKLIWGKVLPWDIYAILCYVYIIYICIHICVYIHIYMLNYVMYYIMYVIFFWPHLPLSGWYFHGCLMFQGPYLYTLTFKGQNLAHCSFLWKWLEWKMDSLSCSSRIILWLLDCPYKPKSAEINLNAPRERTFSSFSHLSWPSCL